MRLPRICILSLILCAGTAKSQDVEMRLELTTPLGTETNHKGDAISARVISPDALKGDIAAGKITNIKSAKRGPSLISVSFDLLKHGTQNLPIAAQIRSVANSKGNLNVDEEGRAIESTNNLGIAEGTTISAVTIDMRSEGPAIVLAPGSRFELFTQSRSKTALDSLRPVQGPVSPASAPAPAETKLTPAAGVSKPAAAEAAAISLQPNLTEVKVDFVPGEKTLFYDDFTDMEGDDPPPHWKVRGGTVALMTGTAARQLTVKGERVILTPNVKSLPKNFTIETEVKMENPDDTRTVWYLHDKTWDGPNGPDAALTVWTSGREGELRIQVRYKAEGANLEDIATTTAKVDFGQPYKQALWIQNGRLRVYVNGQRVVDVNQVELPALSGADLYTEFAENKFGIRMARFAESSPDFSQAMTSSGRYVTHGILFDTDSDKLKPESAPVIKAIAQGLEKNPSLKLQIEGHTDSNGEAAHNLDLSRRRAEAVKSVLVSQFGISADRLTAVGLGASKPVETNDTPSGRAQNRRVELVKI